MTAKGEGRGRQCLDAVTGQFRMRCHEPRSAIVGTIDNGLDQCFRCS